MDSGDATTLTETTGAPAADPSPAPAASDTAPRWGWWLAGFVGLAVVLHLPAFFVAKFNSDETFIATQAHVITSGDNIYRAAADRKPPVVPYLYALAREVTGSNALWAPRLLAALCVGLTAFVLAWEAHRRWGRRAALLTGILFCCATVSFAAQDGQAANFEVFMLLPMAAGVVWAARGHAFAGGIGVAVATLTKQTGAATMLPVLVDAWRARRARGMATAAIGFVLPLVGAAVAFGASDFVYWMLSGNGSYLDLGNSLGYVLLTFVAMTAAFIALNLPISIPLWRAWQIRARADADLWWWLLSALVAIVAGTRFFGHYYLQAIPPMAMLSGMVLARVSVRLARVAVGVSVGVAVVCVAAAIFVKPFDEPVRYERTADYLRTNSSSSDRIVVWGAMPEVYWWSDRLPATRILNTHFIDNAWQAGRVPGDVDDLAPTAKTLRMFLDDFRARPPRYLVDTSTSGARESMVSPITRFPEFASIVANEYRYTTTIDGNTIYERR